MLKLPLADQAVYCKMDSSIFYPVNGTWGKQGATFVDLTKVRKTIFKEALAIAYRSVSTKK